MDDQTSIISVYRKPQEELFARILRAAQAAGMLVLFIQVGFRPGFPRSAVGTSCSAPSKALPTTQALFQGSAGMIHPALGPDPNDILITKHRVSAFVGTHLRPVVRAREIERAAVIIASDFAKMLESG
jgi:nicotinamidase-related amidase